ncbi:dihydrodipicolinate synthase family protein [Geobacillus subterraneus]|uniref:dihydrodipicolinate synthase family protein n=1 Tax=Geobacillus subterraneus TaxID=129338 RepID=UPI00067BD710|nr:dihydrodipicolinate synthase family protein [Geobacillus subterraneus]AKU25403.1 2-keto-3-deoxy-galactonate aldolase [Geobacillus sp. LC300]KZM58863.1 dihydrodipicolinate synthase family protein [Geobacillus stearothermophilus]WPZ16942.1 dihydrodipicolinate synthase family protein [Geobacillus subterraneus]
MGEIFRGIIPPVPTIFNENGYFDPNGMGRLIDFLISSGVHGLFFLGTGGEFSQMSSQQRKDIAEFAVEYVGKRVPVLIGTGGTSTREVVELSEHSEKIGADGVVVINPYYWPLSHENLINHYKAVAESISLPIILYNFPQLTGQDLPPDFVLELVSQYTNIVGIKETTDSAGHIREMILKVKANFPYFSVFAGYDDHLLNTLSLGGDGAISAGGNFAPHLIIGIYNAFKEKDFVRAIELHKQLAYLPMLYKIDSPFVTVVKEAIRLVGVEISTYSLPPARSLHQKEIEHIKEILKRVSLI